VRDSFGGTIDEIAWRIGNGAFVAASAADTSIQAPASDTDLVCVLRVRDNDGNEAVDSVTVVVRDTVTPDTGYLVIGTSDAGVSSLALLGLPTRRLRAAVYSPRGAWSLAVHATDIYVVYGSGAPRLAKFSQPFTDSLVPVYDVAVVDSAVSAQTVAAVGDTKLYLPLNGNGLIIVMRSSDGAVLDTIDLSALSYFDPFDSSLVPPTMSGVVAYNNRVFVSCTRHGFGDGDTCVMAVLCATGDTLLDTIHLRWSCPTHVCAYGEKLYVASGGCTFGSSSGGIEVLDMNSLENLGVVLPQSALGGSVGRITIVGPDKGYAYAFQATAGFVGEVVEFSPTTGAVRPKVGGLGQVADHVHDGTLLHIADAGDTLQVRSYDPSGNLLVGEPVLLPARPQKLFYVRAQ
jgi:hypothetical protein